MSVVNVRELGRSASAVVAGVVNTRRPAVITRSGHPVAVLVALDAGAVTTVLEDWALANLPEFVHSRAMADKESTAGQTVEARAFFAAQGPRRPVKRSVAKRLR